MTGPAIDDDPNRDTRVVVREVFESVRRSVLIVGYAFFGSDKIFEPLARRMGQDPALTARIVVNIHPDGSDSADWTIRRYAADFLRTSWPFHPRPEIYYLPGSMEARGGHRASVHAKLIVADGATIYLGSANFTTAAFERNIEAGIRLTTGTLGSRLTDYFDRMIDKGILSPLPIDERTARGRPHLREREAGLPPICRIRSSSPGSSGPLQLSKRRVPTLPRPAQVMPPHLRERVAGIPGRRKCPPELAHRTRVPPKSAGRLGGRNAEPTWAAPDPAGTP